MANIQLIESIREVETKVNTALAVEVNKSLGRAVNKVRQGCAPIITSALMTSPEISSLAGGILAAEFGLTVNPTSQLVTAIVSSIDVKIEKANAKSLGGFSLFMQPSNFANLFALSVSEQPIEGGSIPWLQWLLTQGDSIIIANFGVEFGNHGRTGEARMSKNFAPYKVNSAFSGTVNDNFITRAVQRVRPQIEAVMRNAI
tara:strand:+ start:233 stop:835 length:603 start_codon:yes stop_codon:yes gene_type:complete